MKTGYIAGCIVGLTMLLAGCSGTPAPPPDTSAADQKAIKDLETAWSGEYASKDLDKIAGHYADDASLMIADMPVMKGKDAIRAGLKDLLSDKNLALSFATSSVDSSKSGDLAYSQGTYIMTSTSPKTKKPVTEKGKYVTVYRKQTDGSWKAVADINNADAPAVPVAAVKAAKKSAPASKKKKKK